MSSPDDRDRAAAAAWRMWRLAVAMVVLELIGGMQVYVSATITPMLAAELGGQHLYGLSAAAAQTTIFLSLPLSPAMMRRWSAPRLLTVFTLVGVLAAVAAALAPTMWSYIAARVVSGLASGALAGVGMGVLAQELTGRARRFTLAANNLVWVASSLAGPVYAAWIAAAFSWRIALVAYLPLLVLARVVIIRELRAAQPTREGERKSIPVAWAITLASGMLLLGLRPATSTSGLVLVVIGLTLAGVAAFKLLPRPVLDPRTTGAPAATRALAWSAALLFGADAIVTIVAHDALAFDARRIGVLLTSGGLAWSLVGLVTAAWPAPLARFRWQGSIAFLAMGAGAAALAWGSTGHLGAFHAGWIMMNLAMGAIFLDAMNIVFDPERPNAEPPATAGATVAFIESLAGAITGTLAAGLVSGGGHLGSIAFLVLALASFPAAHATWRTAPGQG